jgi:hypothetical protein
VASPITTQLVAGRAPRYFSRRHAATAQGQWVGGGQELRGKDATMSQQARAAAGHSQQRASTRQINGQGMMTESWTFEQTLRALALTTYAHTAATNLAHEQGRLDSGRCRMDAKSCWCKIFNSRFAGPFRHGSPPSMASSGFETIGLLAPFRDFQVGG